MLTRTECPVCESHSTRRVHLDERPDEIVEIMVCECGAEYENHYPLDWQEVSHEP